MSVEALLSKISDIQISTTCLHDASEESILDDLRGTITDLLDLYNSKKGESLVIVDQQKIAQEIQAIGKWVDDESVLWEDDTDTTPITSSLQNISALIDHSIVGYVAPTKTKVVPTKTKTTYILWAYATDSYKSVADAIESGGNWEIREIELHEPLTMAMVVEVGGVIDNIREIAVSALTVYGHENDVRFFITDNLETSTDESPVPTSKHCCGRILFEELDDGEHAWNWTQCPEPTEDKVEQVTIPVTIYITATGTNIAVKEDEIRAKLTEVVEHGLKHEDSDKFESDFADLDFTVVETKVLCTEPITYTDI